MKNKNDAAIYALRELKPLFRGFDYYGGKHPGEAASLLSQHGFCHEDVVIWKSAAKNHFPTEAVLNEMYDFCVKHGEVSTDGVVFTERITMARVSASDVNTLIRNYVCARSETEL